MRGVMIFLSTPSARRATLWPNGGEQMDKISIHALREEGDLAETSSQFTDNEFLSTPSARRATITYYPWGSHCSISIHALREEGDDAA